MDKKNFPPGVSGVEDIRKYADGVFVSVNEPGTKWHQVLFLKPTLVAVDDRFISICPSQAEFSLRLAPVEDDDGGLFNCVIREIYYDGEGWTLVGSLPNYFGDGRSAGHEVRVEVSLMYETSEGDLGQGIH